MTTHTTTASLSRRAAVVGLGTAGLSLVRAAPVTTQDATPAPEPTATPPPIQHDKDVIYGEVEGESLLLDVRRPVGWEAPRPAVVIFHGGGLIFGSRADVFVPAVELALLGYVTFAVGYRLFNPETGTNTSSRRQARLEGARCEQ